MASTNGSKPAKVVVCRDLGSDVMPILTERKDINVVLWPEDRACEREWLLKNIKDATGVLVMITDIVNEEFLEAAGPNLRVVSTMSVGYEHVDLKQIAKRGVRLGYTPAVLTDAVADISIMLALMAGRNVNETMAIVREGQWPDFTWSPFAMCGPQISTTEQFPSRTIGFLGFGRIAQATLSRALSFGVTDCIYYSNPDSPPKSERDQAILKQHHPQLKSLRSVNLDTLARESDVVIVLAPGGEKTRHIINEDFLRKMKKHAVFVNAARGTLVDSDALAKALREKWIWGAGLDVVEGEPNMSKDHPLLKEPRCNIVPHIGSATFETRLGMATLAANNLVGGILGDKMPAELDASS
ncbi:D-isomer specific 2-hydroxyacid dehydrogenase [Marasmius fiardii PR-910]|nr:D-isomer specific 2-hydroxyacid dehydrogenase [Marasmius fiardii PR-910]